ncbi:MAG: hypothetical protein IPM79_22295 [Polyangiaceae bacterium]|nr:hypothetical protein [Polyangiaceae bacterium]
MQVAYTTGAAAVGLGCRSLSVPFDELPPPALVGEPFRIEHEPRRNDVRRSDRLVRSGDREHDRGLALLVREQNV